MSTDPSVDLSTAAPDASPLLVVHAVWLPGIDDTQPGSLLVWGELGRVPLRKDLSQGTRRLHPFSASPAELLRRLPGLRHTLAAGRRLVVPCANDVPLASDELLRSTFGQTDAANAFGFWRVEGVTIEIRQTLSWLLSLGPDELNERAIRLSDDFKFWQAAARLARDILLGEYFLPSIERPAGVARAVWRPLLDAPGVADKVHALTQSMPPSCFSSAMDPDSANAHTDASTLLKNFLVNVIDTEVRLALRDGAFARPNARTAADLWMLGLSAPQPVLRMAPQEAVQIENALASWKKRLQAAAGGGLRACLKLTPPADGNPKKNMWRLDYLVQASADPSLLVSAAEVWAGAPSSKKLAELSLVMPEERLLTALEVAGRVFPPIEKSLTEPDPDHAPLSATEAHRFLKHAVPLLADAGFGIFLPPWWKNGKMARLKVQLTVRPKTTDSGLLGMKSLVEFDWKLALGKEALTKKEFEELSHLKVPLIQFRGQWVEINPDNLNAATAYWNSQKGQALTIGDVLQRLGPDGDDENVGLDVDSVQGEGWVDEFLNGNSGEHRFNDVSVPADLNGHLRPYQEKGLSWLSFLCTYGFGGCLADDMGLGKTIQALAFLLREKAAGRLAGPALLVCPTSVAGNWLKEARRFSPTLRVLIHHGTTRTKDRDAFFAEIKNFDLVVSTYALARKDAALFAEHDWSGIILDEAQNIKNPESLQSRAVRTLQGGFRIALTGTPVENRLSELWSIMEFLNPGYLGGPTEFHNKFAVPIERFQDQRASATLRRMAQPFILRRLKTDPKIISDLPEKMEMKVFCTLTREQATLYRAVVSDMMNQIESASGLARRGLVLAALTKLKQVLNHPAHFLKDGSALPGRSGKLDRLTEMLDEALSENDSALIFTQYREMGELLKTHLQRTLMQPALFFHGGLAKGKRDDMVARFQSGQERVMVLTLKAGGVGINLTRANHVFHFDRWWNPAIENQATDRAYRIGQTKKVQVHKLLCMGTLEEKIDAMIESKKKLTETVLSAGESWLTELSNTELRNIFELRDETL
jgi:SNF2 family DNA or RNA helicase